MELINIVFDSYDTILQAVFVSGGAEQKLNNLIESKALSPVQKEMIEQFRDTRRTLRRYARLAINGADTQYVTLWTVLFKSNVSSHTWYDSTAALPLLPARSRWTARIRWCDIRAHIIQMYFWECIHSEYVKRNISTNATRNSHAAM